MNSYCIFLKALYYELDRVRNNRDYCAKLLLISIEAKNLNIALIVPKTTTEFINVVEKHLDPMKNVLVAQHQFDIGYCKFMSTYKCKTLPIYLFLRAQFIRDIRENTIRNQLLQSEVSTHNDGMVKAVAIDSKELSLKDINHNTHRYQQD